MFYDFWKDALSEPPTGTNAQCVVKGNISASGVRIYHVAGGAFYDRVKAEQCFASENEAKSAGFRKSSR
jgi:micrococcal nuclease